MSSFIKGIFDKKYQLSSIRYNEKNPVCLINDTHNGGVFEVSPVALVRDKTEILENLPISDAIKIVALATNATKIIVFPEKAFQFKYFPLILTFFAAALLTSNVAAIKLISVFGITLTGGFIIFPFTFVLGSILAEVYGYKNARQAIWSGFALNLFFTAFIDIIAFLPPSPWWHLDSEFKQILLPENRIVVSSLISFLVSDFINTYTLVRLKISYCGEFLFKRIMFSSFSSIFIGTIIFIGLAFYGTMPDSALLILMGVAFAKKIISQVVLFPLTAILIKFFKKKEGVDVYDYHTKFNPFSLDTTYSADCYHNSKLTAE